MAKKRKEKRKWKCSNCGDISIERVDPIFKDTTGQSIPLFGWACLKCGMKGRRRLLRKESHA